MLSSVDNDHEVDYRRNIINDNSGVVEEPAKLIKGIKVERV